MITMASDGSATSTKSTSMEAFINQALDKNCNEECALTKQNRKLHYRQTILSEYFPKQATEKLSDKKSKSDAIMINFPKLLSQLLNAKVIIERLSQSAAKAKLCPKLQINLERLQLDQLNWKNDIDYVRYYCRKCKTMDTDCAIKRKKCQKCETDLMYVCMKCNDNIYVSYRRLKRHRKSCKGQKNSSDQGKPMILNFCADCNFITAYKSAIRWHVSRMKHQIRDNEMIEGL